MRIYRDAVRRAGLTETLAEVRDAVFGAPDAARAEDALIRFGMAEAAVADARAHERDDAPPDPDPWGDQAARLAALYRAALDGAPTASLAAEARAGLDRLTGPAELALRTPEGFAWYALDPAAWLRAGRTLGGEGDGRAVVVIGLRSIGTTLSALVAEGLRAEGARVRRLTLRPRGDPFDRAPALSGSLARALAEAASGGARFLVADEGPGLSGSSLVGTAEALERLGAPTGSIGFVCANDPDPEAFRSPRARARWRDFPRTIASAFDRPPPVGADGSGGLWRGGARVLAEPAFERPKRLSPDRRIVWKFAGRGPFGRARLELAEADAQAGRAPRPIALRDGWLGFERVEGRRATRAVLRRRADEAIDRLAWIGRERQTGRAVDPAPILTLLRRNADLLLGEKAAARVEALIAAAGPLDDAPEVRIDGRLLAHEWIETPDGRLIKTDGIDHHDDHFQPGATDLAWDAAGLSVEAGLPLRDVVERLGDPGTARRAPLYEAAYLAFRAGLTEQAARLAPEPDRSALVRVSRAYAARLDRALTRAAGL